MFITIHNTVYHSRKHTPLAHLPEHPPTYTPTPTLLTQPTYTHHYYHHPDTLAHHWLYTHHSNLIRQLPGEAIQYGQDS